MTKSSLPPSLLDNTDTYQTKNTGPSLLTSLGNTTSPPPVKKRGQPLFWFIILPLMLISLVVAAAMTIADRTNTPITASTPSKIPAAVVPPTAPAPIQTATIINDPLTSDPHERLNSALTGKQTASAPSVLAAAPAKISISSSAPAVTASINQPTATIKPKKSATDKTHSADPDDHDVKLLTALVATTPIAKEQTSKTHDPKTKHTTSKAQTKTTGKEDNRDIVERKSGDSTANLLARCKKLGIIEGELCRWRICADRWDTDPVCKASAHPKNNDNLAQ